MQGENSRPVPEEVRASAVDKSAQERFESQEQALRDAGIKLARAVAALEPDERYHPTMPAVFAVGGFVRDMMIGIKPKDMDVEVYGVDPERLKELLASLFGRVDTVGEAFGILKVRIGDGLELDVSIPRRESKAGAGHRGFLVDSDPSLGVVEAGRRRDFTMNSMAYDLANGVSFDPFGGLEDLEKRELRVTDHERFEDDPLRVMRAAQFAARFGLVVESASFMLMKEMIERGDLAELPAERIFEEWRKLLLKSARPSIGIELLRALGATEKHFPELHALIDVEQEKEWHPEGDVWRHTMMVTDEAAKIIRREDFSSEEKEVVMFGALCHDVGKPAVTQEFGGRIRSHGHEEDGVEPTKVFLRRMRVSNVVEDGVLSCVRDHLKPELLHIELEKGRMDEVQYANAVRKLLKRIAPLSWKAFLAVCEADSRGRALPGVQTNPYFAGEKMAQVIARERLDAAPTQPIILGRDVLALVESRGQVRKPGQWVGEAIKRVEAMRDAGEIVTREQALEALSKLEL